MTNAEIAQTLYEIAELLDLKQENRFKVRAYERAAKAIDHALTPACRMLEEGTLRSLGGVGDAIESLVREICETGECQLHLSLRDEFPLPILSLLQIPDLGYARATRIYEQFGISDLATLETALREGRLDKVRGFSARSTERILKNIGVVRQGGGRLRLDDAGGILDSLVERVASEPGVQAASAAGAVRRRQESVGSLSMVAAAEDAASALASFLESALVGDVLERVGTRIVARTRSQVAVALRVVAPVVYGAALAWDTGGEAHVAVLAERAAERGLAFTSDGLLRGAAVVPTPDEQTLYAALGLPFMPPEIRGGAADVERVATGGLPRLVELSDMRGDLHAHTNWTDGVATLDEMAAAARARGYDYVAITDHSRSLKITRGLSIERLQEQGRLIDALNRRWEDFRVLKGSECDILADGSMDFPDEVLAELDVVIGSIHSQFKLDRAAQTERLLRAMHNPHVDIIGHPSGRLILRRDGYDLDWDAVVAAARETGTALEINAYPDRLDINDEHARQVAEAGGWVAIDSDSHSTGHFRFMPFGVGVARRGWLGPSQVLNALPLPDLMRRLGGSA